MKPDRVTIRSYQVGFGDCFLASFRYPDGERHLLIDFGSTGAPKDAPDDLMDRVAADIAQRSDGKLAAVIATHRHKDHISGFARNKAGTAPGDVIRGLRPDLVVQPWTEQPDLPVDAEQGTPASGPHKGMAPMARSLGAMQAVATSLGAEAGRAHYLSGGRRGQLAFLADDNGLFPGEDGLSNLSAVTNLMTMAPNDYVFTGKATRLAELLPGVAIDVLGPPTVVQTETIKKQRSRDADEFWQLRAVSDPLRNAPGGERPAPLFPGHVAARHPEDKYPIEARWLIYHVQNVRSDQMLQLVRMLDKAMNNTSLILLFRLGGKSLLFPGDAQIENWRYALSQAGYVKLLKQVDVYKVGHHGSLNATPKSLWKLFARKSPDAAAPRRLRSLMSTMHGKHGSDDKKTEVPRRTLVDALKAESDLSTTEDYGVGELFRDTVIEL